MQLLKLPTLGTNILPATAQLSGSNVGQGPEGKETPDENEGLLKVTIGRKKRLRVRTQVSG